MEENSSSSGPRIWTIIAWLTALVSTVCTGVVLYGLERTAYGYHLAALQEQLKIQLEESSASQVIKADDRFKLLLSAESRELRVLWELAALLEADKTDQLLKAVDALNRTDPRSSVLREGVSHMASEPTPENRAKLTTLIKASQLEEARVEADQFTRIGYALAEQIATRFGTSLPPLQLRRS